jgi:hypothetical protein
MGDEQPEERDAFAVLQVTTRNTRDEQNPLPDATDIWELFYGDQQIGQSFNFAALEAEGYSQLEGGTVQGGVTREGAILFEVDGGFSSDEIDALWSDNFQYVEEVGQTIDVRWTANPSCTAFRLLQFLGERVGRGPFSITHPVCKMIFSRLNISCK